MAMHFRAEQYNGAFDSKKVQNWQIPRCYREKPRSFDGFTQIVANDRGHLLPGIKRCRDSPWGMFVGTWDMPLKIPAPLNPTARTQNAILRLERSRTDGDIILRGKLKKCKVPDALRVKEDIKANDVIPPDPFETLVTGADGSAIRSGAMCPEPLSTSPKMPPIRSRSGTPKILTPQPLEWPKPQSPARSAGSRRSPKVYTPPGPATTNAAVAGSVDIAWPKPATPLKTPEQQKS